MISNIKNYILNYFVDYKVQSAIKASYTLPDADMDLSKKLYNIKNCSEGLANEKLIEKRKEYREIEIKSDAQGYIIKYQLTAIRDIYKKSYHHHFTAEKKELKNRLNEYETIFQQLLTDKKVLIDVYTTINTLKKLNDKETDELEKETLNKLIALNDKKSHQLNDSIKKTEDKIETCIEQLESIKEYFSLNKESESLNKKKKYKQTEALIIRRNEKSNFAIESKTISLKIEQLLEEKEERLLNLLQICGKEDTYKQNQHTDIIKNNIILSLKKDEKDVNDKIKELNKRLNIAKKQKKTEIEEKLKEILREAKNAKVVIKKALDIVKTDMEHLKNFREDAKERCSNLEKFTKRTIDNYNSLNDLFFPLGLGELTEKHSKEVSRQLDMTSKERAAEKKSEEELDEHDKNKIGFFQEDRYYPSRFYHQYLSDDIDTVKKALLEAKSQKSKYEELETSLSCMENSFNIVDDQIEEENSIENSQILVS